MSNIKIFEEKMQKSVSNLESDFMTIRAGRANPHLLDKIKVQAYGTEMSMNEIGNISTPEARLIQISPYDVSTLKDIEKAINMSDLGINPTNDGKVIRLVFPELTEQRRKDLTKDIKKKGEDVKVAIRNIRRDAIDTLKKMQKTNEISEDELKSLEDKVQKLTDKYVSEIDKKVENKNKEIMSI